jgi:acyl carrier protein phosphodiesterase
MNILAHAYLSDRNNDWLIGNFIGDFIKGDPTSPRHGLRAGEIDGVRIHRAIDAFTDSHSNVAAVRDLLRPRCHKYAGVAVDVFFDYLLATDFTALTGEQLPVFTSYFYTTLQQHTNRLPQPARRMLDAMIRYDWIGSYQTTTGIDRALNGIARRTPYVSGLDTAVEDLIRFDELIRAEFSHFWPDLVAHVRGFKP